MSCGSGSLELLTNTIFGRQPESLGVVVLLFELRGSIADLSFGI